MAAAREGLVEIVNSNIDRVFTNTQQGDFAIYTTTSNQAIHFGTTSNAPSALKVTTSNIEFANVVNALGNVNVSGSLRVGGTDVALSNHIHDLTTSSITGVLPLTKGGTGISTATGTTGIGNLVLNSNPTFAGTITTNAINALSSMTLGSFGPFKIAYGIVNNTSSSGSVNFGTTFSAAPVVTSTLIINANERTSGITVHSVTTTTFSFCKTTILHNNSGFVTQSDAAFYWIAIGPA